MLKPSYSTQFKKDFKKLAKSGRHDIEKLKIVASLLINEQPLPIRNRDHALSGNFKERRECHIEPDWLLIYKIDHNSGEIIFERTGSHSELFE